MIGAERFVREIQTIAALQHPHILGLIDSGEVNGTAYYVMPFVEGESLRDRITREKQLSIADSVRIATEVASALDYAHRHGVIHRDIKPENILMHDGQALVADFGIALAVSSAGGSRMTETGMSLGTPHYMSPEQAMGERAITARSDIYALGCVTYEMLTGDPPLHRQHRAGDRRQDDDREADRAVASAGHGSGRQSRTRCSPHSPSFRPIGSPPPRNSLAPCGIPHESPEPRPPPRSPRRRLRRDGPSARRCHGRWRRSSPLCWPW